MKKKTTALVACNVQARGQMLMGDMDQQIAEMNKSASDKTSDRG